MKSFRFLAFITVLIVACSLSYYAGYHNNDTKNYEAACLQADFIHSIMDWDTECWNVGEEVRDSYEEWFNDLDEGAYNTRHITRKELENYSWCY